MARPNRKAPGGSRQPEARSTRQDKPDVQPDADGVWRCPQREGFSVHVSERGNVVVGQGWPESQTIVLHVDEVSELRDILASAERQARRQRQ
jgi:hypothetical protein